MVYLLYSMNLSPRILAALLDAFLTIYTKVLGCYQHGAWCMVHGAWCMVHGAYLNSDIERSKAARIIWSQVADSGWPVDDQWMTSGCGVVHEEIPTQSNGILQWRFSCGWICLGNKTWSCWNIRHCACTFTRGVLDADCVWVLVKERSGCRGSGWWPSHWGTLFGCEFGSGCCFWAQRYHREDCI